MKSGKPLVAIAAALLVSAPACAGGYKGGYGYRGGGYGYKVGYGYPAAGYGYYNAGGYYNKSRVVVGVGIGVPLYWGSWGYYPPAYAYPPAYYSPPAYYYQPAAGAYPAPAYVERADERAPPAEQASNWWYYCVDAKAYYPYVRDCPGGWQRVAPQPPPPR